MSARVNKDEAHSCCVPGGHYHCADSLCRHTHTDTSTIGANWLRSFGFGWWTSFWISSSPPDFLLLSRCFPSNSPYLGFATGLCSSLRSGLFISTWSTKPKSAVTTELSWQTSIPCLSSHVYSASPSCVRRACSQCLVGTKLVFFYEGRLET